MTTQHNRKALFFSLLKCDQHDRVEESSEFVSELPARIAACMDAAAPCQHNQTYQTVRECVQEFVAEQRRGLFHEPTDFDAYCDEADISYANGNNDRALGFLGRALEAAAIQYAMRALAEQQRLPPTLERLYGQPDLQHALVEQLHTLLQSFGLMFIEFLERATSQEHATPPGSPSSSPRLMAFFAAHADGNKEDGREWIRQLSRSNSSSTPSAMV